MKRKILIWDNDGTVTGSKSPNDTGTSAKSILPGVWEFMHTADFNFIISGCKTPESEAQDFDPDKIAGKFIDLMKVLPLNAAAFSPTIGGGSCYVVIKRLDNSIVIKKAHEDHRYRQYRGQFKKPDIGMFVVMRDLAWDEFGAQIDANSSTMIGDSWHDEAAAKAFQIPFIEAKAIHFGEVP